MSTLNVATLVFLGALVLVSGIVGYCIGVVRANVRAAKACQYAIDLADELKLKLKKAGEDAARRRYEQDA